MPTQIKKYLTVRKGFKSRVLLACKKATAASCIVGIVMITNTSFASAYEAHTVNVTARIVNNVPDINPPGGEFCTAGEFKVELNVSLASADIYYTIDGTDPVCGVNKYGAPFELPNNTVTTVKAVACHNMMRNGEQVLIQSAVMKKVFDVSEPSVNVIKPENEDVWYCNPSSPIIYPVEWTIENYRGVASELDIDIIYIIDDGKNENGGVTGEIDDKDTRFYNLPGTTGLTGENTSYQFELTQEYCYYGHGWMKVIATEPNNCSGFGISGRIFDPMAPDDSCGVSASNDDDNVPAVSLGSTDVDIEPEPAIDEENSENENIDDIVVDVDNTGNEDAESEESNDNDNVPAVSLGSTDIDIEPEPAIDEENSENENIDGIVVDVNNTGNEDAESEESTDENTNDVDMNTENDDETNDDTGNENTDDNADDLDDEEDNIDNDENGALEDDGIIIDREEDFDEENNTDDDNADEDVNDGEEDIDDDSIADNDVSPDDDISDDIDDDENISDNSDNGDDSNSGDSDDNDSLDDAPTIEDDDNSTEIEFSF